jgi:hypothetical protein
LLSLDTLRLVYKFLIYLIKLVVDILSHDNLKKKLKIILVSGVIERVFSRLNAVWYSLTQYNKIRQKPVPAFKWKEVWVSPWPSLWRVYANPTCLLTASEGRALLPQSLRVRYYQTTCPCAGLERLKLSNNGFQQKESSLKTSWFLNRRPLRAPSRLHRSASQISIPSFVLFHHSSKSDFEFCPLFTTLCFLYWVLGCTKAMLHTPTTTASTQSLSFN